MPKETVPFKIIEVSLTTITLNEDGIWHTVSIDQATLAPWEKFAERKLLYITLKAVDEEDDRVDKTGGKYTAEDLTDKLHDYGVDRIVCHSTRKHP